ncbi:MAG: flagellar biosynthesis anti-sigma factor FlgM [Myxococcota bacterium]
MKIGRLPPMPAQDGTGTSAPRTANGESSADEATKVSLSKDAAFVADMRSKANRAVPKVRDDVVEKVKAELEAGTFEENTDMQKVVDGLLADL